MPNHADPIIYNADNNIANGNSQNKPKKKMSLLLRFFIAIYVIFAVAVFVGAIVGWSLLARFSRVYLGIPIREVLAISMDLQNTSTDNLNEFDETHLLEFENHVLQQLFLRSEVEIPYGDIFDAIFNGNLFSNNEEQPIISDATNGRIRTFAPTANNQVRTNNNTQLPLTQALGIDIPPNNAPSTLLDIVTNILVRENVCENALLDFSPNTAHAFRLSDQQLAAFLDRVIYSGIVADYVEIGDNAFAAILTYANLAQVRFSGTNYTPYMQVTASFEIRQMARDLIREAMPRLPNFLANIGFNALLPQTAYLSLHIGLSPDNIGLQLQINNFDNEQMARFYRLLDSIIDLSNSVHFFGGMTNYETRNANPNFVRSNVAYSLNYTAHETLFPVMHGLAVFADFDDIQNGFISTNLFETIIALSGVNYDYYGNRRIHALYSSDVIMSLRFFILRIGDDFYNHANPDYIDARNALSDNLFLSQYARDNFYRILRDSIMQQFSPYQFNIAGRKIGESAISSLAHDTRTLQELQTFIVDADLAAILQYRVLDNATLGVEYIELAGLTTSPILNNGNNDYLLTTHYSPFGKMSVVFRIDLHTLFYDYNIAFLNALIIDALYIEINFYISPETQNYALDEYGEIYYFYYYASVYANSLPHTHDEIISLFNIVRFFTNSNIDIDNLIRSAGREVFSFFYDMRNSWASENINFANRITYIDGVRKTQTGILIASIFDLLASTHYGTNAKDLQYAIQGMFAYNAYAGNSRNFVRDNLVLNPIQNYSPSVLPNMIITDNAFGALLVSDWINQFAPLNNNIFVDNSGCNRYSLVQFNSTTNSRLYFTFRTYVDTVYDFTQDRYRGFNSLMPDYLYFTFAIEHLPLNASGYNFRQANYDYDRLFRINNLSYQQQKQLFMITGYDYNSFITAKIFECLEFLNTLTIGDLSFGGGVVTLPSTI